MQQHKYQIKISWKKLAASLLSVLSITSPQAQTQEQIQAPKLIIGITIDQLRGDYLQYCLQSFGNKGFKRLLNEGAVYRQVKYDYPEISSASSFATIFTGTNPYYHGITGNKKFDWDKQREVSILYDPEFLGNYTSETFSPKNLMSSTIADELKVASGGRSLVFAIAPEAEQAIISGGHAANAAFWIENYNGKWATSTYYKDIPWYVERYNSTESLAYTIDQSSWQPASNTYGAFPYTQGINTFHYTFFSKDKYLQFKTSPLVNKEVTKLAGRFFQYADFGTRTYPSMLLLTYYAGNYKDATNKEFSYEIQDTYYRLDKEIEELLSLAEKHVGLKNTLVYISSTGYFEQGEINKDVLPPAGKFYPERCTALLNMYLMSVYGQGNWVLGFYQNQIFLNHKLIEDKQIPLGEIQRKAAEFTIQFSGVQDVATLTETLYGNWNENVARFRNGSYKSITGDIILELQPGWILSNEQDSSQNKQLRSNPIISPLIFFGHNVKPQIISSPVKATQIAPTITHVLRIRPPNAAKELPLEEFILP